MALSLALSVHSEGASVLTPLTAPPSPPVSGQAGRALADGLTLLRGVIALPVLLGLQAGWGSLAWGLLLLGGLSDAADGWLARRSGGGSVWGARLDPLTDKLLISAPLLWLGGTGRLPLAAVWLLLAREILDWWRGAPEIPSVLFCYAFGKAQRILAELHALGVGEEVLLHGAVQTLIGPYREAGIALGATAPLSAVPKGQSLAGRLILAPPSAQGSPWMRRLARAQTAFASGWMTVRGARRRRAVGRGFVLSDHADWPSLVRTILETGARQVYLTHGHGEALARFLREVEGVTAQPLHSGEAGAWSREEEAGASAPLAEVAGG